MIRRYFCLTNYPNLLTLYLFSLFDTAEERYNKLHQKVSDITCIQLGIAIYIYDAKNKTFKTKTYSFYTYPQTFYKSDSVVNFQTSCVEFLCKHNFDFNKVNIVLCSYILISILQLFNYIFCLVVS